MDGSPQITSEPWGQAHDAPVELFTLSNSHGISVKISTYGGLVQAIWVPDRAGRLQNVVLGFATLDAYLRNNADPPPPSGATCFGAIVGRYANRIADGAFDLDGRCYRLPANNGQNTLHGGPGSYNTQVWEATIRQPQEALAQRSQEATARLPEAALVLAYTDPSGKNGFPGTVVNEVTYTLTEDDALRIDYRATTDQPTIINLTNHTYFNLAGEGSGDVYGQLMEINADHYTPVDSNMIPTGEIAPVAGTPLDFRQQKPIGRDIRSGFEQLLYAHGYDHNFALYGSGLRLAARAEDPVSGRTLSTYTDQPGVQLYTGNFLAGELLGSAGCSYRQGDGFALETQHFPDSIHHPAFPSSILRPGESFSSTTIFEFSTGGRRPGSAASSR